MIFKETRLKGVYIIEVERLQDERGFFVRTFCREEFEKHGLNIRVVQCNVSYNRKKGTLRGMHYQLAPYSEAKLVTCVAGSIYDVVSDLRPESPTYCKWLAIELSACPPRSMLYIPENFAHGFQTLADDTEVFYQMSESYHPDSARGLRWDDPAFDIAWPAGNRIVSQRDQSFPDFVR
ncbi:MAG TPA: dTDP-4-dehydrorhamnose 3,5-epimerase [Acidobacteriota bacterium]|nr:dTDP-4-dehydrorhamnose 3,5-epimerase [Acidobacteriota bacterium]